MKPSALAASSTGQCLACCGSSGRDASRFGAWPVPGRLEFGKVRTSISVSYAELRMPRCASGLHAFGCDDEAFGRWSDVVERIAGDERQRGRGRRGQHLNVARIDNLRVQYHVLELRVRGREADDVVPADGFE